MKYKLQKDRDSNMELLRIVAMFLVLVVHADFFSLGIPTYEESIQDVLPTISRFFFQSLSICCVDVFVLISGWFGIRPNLKSFLSFIFQCLFFLCGIYFVCLISGYTSFSCSGVLECFVMTKHNWFIKSYIFLYILAPILNSFVKYTSEKELRHTLIAFYAFQTIFGWGTSSVSFFVNGYSTTSFIGLYLLARYIKLYNPCVARIKKTQNLLLFVAIVVVLTLVAYLLCRFNVSKLIPSLYTKIYSYINPLVILSALFLLLYFSKLNIHNTGINKIAASCFAVFLLHQNANLIPWYKNCVLFCYNSFCGLRCLLLISAYLVSVFFFAIIVDRIRLLCWNLLVLLFKAKQEIYPKDNMPC